MNKILLVLKDICKKYQQGKSFVEVLNNVNLTVKQGELIAIIGSSGSGKSTLLHIAGLLDAPNSGLVEIDSVNYFLKESHLVRLNNIGFVYQQHHLLKEFTAVENVAMPRLIAGNDYKLALDEAEYLLAELGLANKIANMPGELSGGEQQRVAIARSLINKPKIILADEPTGNLDPSCANEVFNLFIKTASQQNTAIIMVTHNHQMAEKMDKIYELRYGVLQDK
jgi:lipoprotein-releasing system ATP-binding protein